LKLFSVLGFAFVAGIAGQAAAQDAGGPKPAGDRAQGPWTISGSSRLRYEVIDGQTRPGANARDDLISLRTTLQAEYKADRLRLVGEVYDSRIWEAEAGTPVGTNEVNTLEVVQAYAALDVPDPFGAGSSATVQAGRFTLNLGSRRLIAADDYRNTTNGYTGVRLDAQWPGVLRATAIYVMPQVRLPDDIDSVLDNDTGLDRESDDLQLWGGMVSGKLPAALGVLEGSWFHLEEKDRPDLATRDRSLDTVSLRLIRDPAPGAWDYEAEVIGQTGTVRASVAPAAPVLDVSAGFAHLEAAYSFDHPWRPRLAAEFDYASGDDAGGSYGRFDTLFGMRRADLAPAGLYNAIGRTNLVTPGLRLELTPSRRWDAFLAYRGLWLASAQDAFSTTGVRDPSGKSGRFAGTQLEGRVRYWLVPKTLRFELNGVWLDKGRFLKTAPNATTTGDSHYLSASITASF